MKILFIITILLVFQSCQARDLKLEIDKAFKENNITKIDKLLSEYYQINGTDFLLETSLLKVALLKKDYKRVFEIFQNTKYIEIKKDKKINKELAAFIISSAKKTKLDKRLEQYKAALKTFPYSKDIYNEYLKTLLQLGKTNKALKAYLKFDEIFNKTNKFLDEIILSKLKELYLQEHDIKILNLISKIETNVSFIEKEVIENSKVLLNLKELPKTFNTKILKKIIPNKNYSLSKAAIKFFILIGEEKDVKEYINKLYSRSDIGLKTFIYSYYYQRFNIEIDDKLMKKLMRSTNPFEVKTAIEIITQNKITKHKDEFKRILGKPKDFRCSKKYLLDALFVLDRDYLKSFALSDKFPKFKDTEKKLKLTELNLGLGIKTACNVCSEVLKDSESSEFFKAGAIKLMIMMKKDISFFKEYDNYIYYLVFLKNSKYLNDKQLEKMSISGYKNWKKHELLVKYLNKLSIPKINKFLARKEFKEMKDQYHLKLVYYSVLLQKTDSENDKFSKFILKNRFHKPEYINLFKFSKKHLNTLVKLYIVENRSDMKIKILEKIVNIK